MKISILTFSKEDNNGANLQCYALVETLKEMGHDVDIIDIQLSVVNYGLFNRLLHYPQHLNYVRFRKRYLNCFTKSFHDVAELTDCLPKSDLYIVGSDQVWNLDITKRLDPLIYFFSFLPSESRRMAYAASFGVSDWIWNQWTPRVSKLLAKFDAISVREIQGAEICKKTFGLKAEVVCDPTFLLPSYDHICGTYTPTRATNNIVYFKFIRSSEIEKLLLHEAKKLKLNVVKLGDFHPRVNCGFKPYYSVEGWLNNIRYAHFVLTDSFHCMVFCILFNKPFISMPGAEGRSSRMISLLKSLNLYNRFCHDVKELQDRFSVLYETPIDYASVNQKIAEMRRQGRNFLKASISNIL